MNVEEFRRLTWVDYLLLGLVEPRGLYRIIRDRAGNGIGMSFTVPVFQVFAEVVTLSLLVPQDGFFYYKISYGWILVSLFLVLRMVIAASLMDLAAQFMGFDGRVREMVSLVNFAVIPQVMILPLVYIFTLFHFAPLFFYLFFSLGLVAWSVFIAVLGISEMHGITFGRALLIYIFPAVLVWGTGFFLVFLAVINLFGFITTR